MKQERFTATVWREGDLFVAQCREIEIASQGETEQEALENLSEAISVHFEPPAATILPDVRMIEVNILEEGERGVA